MRFDQQVVVITGAGRDGQVGEVVAAAFAERGARLALVDRDPAVAAARASALRGRVERVAAFAADLADPDAVATLARSIEQAFGPRIDAFVHLAGGFAMGGPVADDDPALWQRMLAINLLTAANAARALLPALRAARGAIVLTASESVLPGARIAGTAAYAAAKSGVAALALALAQEERENGVRCNAIAPATIRTAANVAAMGEEVAYVEREAVADAILWLCSPLARAVTGEIIHLSAGAS